MYSRGEIKLSDSDIFITQFEKGNGMDRRKHNIQEIIKLKKQEKSDDDIINIAGLYLRDATIREYLRIAKYHIKNEQHDIVYLKGTEPQKQPEETESNNNNESFMDYAKKHPQSTNTCKNCGKSTPANTTFCSKDCVEKYKAKLEADKP